MFTLDRLPSEAPTSAGANVDTDIFPLLSELKSLSAVKFEVRTELMAPAILATLLASIAVCSVTFATRLASIAV